MEWSCLADPAALVDEPVLLRLVLLDEATEQPILGARVRTCQRSDLDCVASLGGGVSNAQGAVVLTMNDEYLEISAAGYRSTLMMGLGSLEVTSGQRVPLDVHFDLYSTASFEALTSASGVEADAALADVEVLARNCAYQSAGGVVVDIDGMVPATRLRYLVNDLPSATALETDEASGSALIFNVAPGLRSVSAVVADSALPVGGQDAVLAVIARAGWLSQVAGVPRGIRITDIEGD